MGRLTLTRATLLDGVRELTARDAALARVVERHGPPPLWARRRGYATLVRIILEQQVSLASADALYRRLERSLPGGVTPASVRTAGRPALQALGVTRQKARYACELADRVTSGAIALETLARLPDEDVVDRLTGVPGIGPWTAGIYLLMALRRPDVWPPGDLALHKALARLRGRRDVPTTDEARRLAGRWAPWRAVAARILWHGYLAERAA